MQESHIVIAHGGDLSDATGGTNRIAAFVKSLVSAGYKVHLVIPKPKKPLSRDFEGAYIHDISIKENGIRNQLIRAILVSIKAKKLTKDYGAFLQFELSTLAGIATIFGCKNFILDVNDLSADDPQYTRLPFSFIIKKFIYIMEKKAVENASKIIVVSSNMGSYIKKEWNIPAEKIVTIPNGFFDDKLKSTELSKYIDSKLIVTLGTLFRHINVELLLKLAKSLEYNNTKIILIGDGVLRTQLEKEFLKRKIKNVMITGWLPYEDALKLTSEACIAFHIVNRSLTTEVACPVKLLDYAALGIPMVLSDVSELSLILKGKKLALVSNPNDPDEFIENVIFLLKEKQLRESMSKQILEFSKEYTWGRQGAKLVDLITNMT